MWTPLGDVNRRANQRRSTRETARSLRPPCASCGGAKVVTCEGMPVSGMWPRREHVHAQARWISSYERRGDNRQFEVSSFERNPELFPAQWGNSTTIRRIARRVPLKRMAKINFHQSMCHKDRALYHAYTGIDEKGRDIPENVRARQLYT